MPPLRWDQCLAPSSSSNTRVAGTRLQDRYDVGQAGRKYAQALLNALLVTDIAENLFENRQLAVCLG